MTIFVMHIHTQTCSYCGSIETMSHLYQGEEAARGHKLLPCHSIGPLDPIRRVDLPNTTTPACSVCVSDERAHIGAEVYANWQDTLRRKYAPAPAGAQIPTKRPEPSLDDLA